MWRALSITWDVALHLIEIAVVLAMFHVAKSPFETLVVAGLVLTYLSVIGSSAMLARGLAEKFNQDTARFIALAKALRLNAEPYAEALAEDREQLEKGQVRIWISGAFRMLLALIAAAYLINELWPQLI